MNIEWKLKIDTERYEEIIGNVKSVEDLYTKTKYGYFDLMIYEGGLEDIQNDYYDEELYEEEIFGMDVKDFLETLKDYDDDFDYNSIEVKEIV